MADASAPHRLQAGVGRLLGRGLFQTLYRGRALRPERVPGTGPVVLVANHSAFLDGPLVFSLSPRPANFLVKAEMFHGLWGPIMHAVGQIPIDRSVGDRAALGTAVAVLHRGGVVGIFPEGNRGAGDVEQIHQGAAWVALRAPGTRIVPVAVSGTRVQHGDKDSWPAFRSVLTVDFGEPFALEAGTAASGRTRLREATETVRARLADHVRSSRV